MEFGMYKPMKVTRNIFEHMKSNNSWALTEKIFQFYSEKWDGPDIPIYLFPISQHANFFSRRTENLKGGVSFPDKMFLFVSDKLNTKELEALFVHEYHHVCRLNHQSKKFEEYTLLDSIIIEGLAEKEQMDIYIGKTSYPWKPIVSLSLLCSNINIECIASRLCMLKFKLMKI